MELAPRGLDVYMHIFQRLVPDESALGDFAFNLAQPSRDHLELVSCENSSCGEGGGMRDGTGNVTQMAGSMKFNLTCPRCQGRGKLQSVCPTCHGDGRVLRNETVEVRIPAGAQNGSRRELPTATFNGNEIDFLAPGGAQPPASRRNRVIDHIGFEVKDLEAFCKKLEAQGIKLDRPYTKVPALNIAIAFIQDPWGTYIELTDGLREVD